MSRLHFLKSESVTTFKNCAYVCNIGLNAEFHFVLNRRYRPPNSEHEDVQHIAKLLKR